MTESAPPSIDGNNPFVRKPALSAGRHAREKHAVIAKEAGFSETKETTARRIDYIMAYGSEEVKEAMLAEQVSVWFAYKYVKRQRQDNAVKEFRARLRELAKP